jgi:hypothetical protein
VGSSLVYAPIPKEVRMINEKYTINKITKLSQQYHIKFYNFGRNHQLNSKKDFYDHDHLNKNGVQSFDQLFLAEYLKNGY